MSKTVPLALLVLTATAASADSAKPPAAPPSSLYRLDISITGLDTDPKAAPATYSVMVEENHRATLETRSNIPVQPSGKDVVNRMDVGVKLSLEYRHFDASTIIVDGDVEMSAVEQAAPTTVHRVRADGVTAVTVSGPAQLASVYDNQSHRRYDISITAHKIL